MKKETFYFTFTKDQLWCSCSIENYYVRITAYETGYQTAKQMALEKISKVLNNWDSCYNEEDFNNLSEINNRFPNGCLNDIFKIF